MPGKRTIEVSDKDLVREDTAQVARFFTLIRTVGLIVVAGLIIIFELFGLLSFPARPILLYVLPIYFVVSLKIYRVTRRSGFPEWPLIIQLLADIIVLALGIGMTGGLLSPFRGLYAVVLISASLVSSRAMALVGGAIFLALLSGALQAPIGTDIFNMSAFVLIIGIIGFQAFLLVQLIRNRDRALERQKEEFLFRTVHDIRTPSTIIRYSAELMRDQALSPPVQDQLVQIETANARINGMVSELMAIARGESGKMKLSLELVSVLALARKLAENFRKTAQERQVEIVVSGDDVSVTADKLRLEEALTNLVDNAIKYNRRGGRIEIAVKRRDGATTIAVRDTGIGIKPEHQGDLFKPYFREARSADVTGTGLGLYGAKKLVEAMGGSIRYETKTDGGTTFFVDFPTVV